VVAAECRDGIPANGEYGRLLSEAGSHHSLLQKIHENDFIRQDMWQAQVHGMICQKADVYFHSRNLSDEQIKRAFLRPCSNVEDTIEELLHKYGRDASICVLPEGPQTIPCTS
jgi:nickel-dependent lactate racemase